MADKTVKVPNIGLATSEFDFLPKHLGVKNDEDTITLDTWIDWKQPDETDLLI